MVNLENYLYDGAGWQARAVMCYLQSRVESILDKTYTGDSWMPYKGQIFINQYNYGREKGYVFSIRYDGHQANYAVYEHCMADCICVVKSNVFTDHSDGWDGREWSKYDHDKEFSYGDAIKCGEFIENDMKGEIAKWSKKSKYDEEKERLVDTIRKAVKEKGGFGFEYGEKMFTPIFCGDPREESIIDVFVEENDDVTIVTTYLDEDGMQMDEETNCEEFSNDEIKEIIKLLGI